MKSIILSIICIAAILGGTVTGLSVKPIHLAGHKTHMTYFLQDEANNSLIICNYKLDPRELLSRVSWEMTNDAETGTYEWRPNGGGQATGALEGVVKLDRGDGNLELSQLRYDLNGMYQCSVELTDGTRMTSPEKAVVIIDSNNVTSISGSGFECVEVASFRSPAIYPEPTVTAGMYSEQLGRYYEEVPDTKWKKDIHLNKSVTYSFKDVNFTVDENTPLDIKFNIEVGVTTSQGDYISLSGYSSHKPLWEEFGCPDLKEEGNTTVNYFPSYGMTCRGGRKNTTKATVVCKEDYHHVGKVKEVAMKCNETTRSWQPEKGAAASMEDVVCVSKEDFYSSTVDNQASSSRPAVPVLVVLALLLTISRTYTSALPVVQ